MANVRAFKNFETPKEEGTYNRLLCLNGRAKGVAYFITGRRCIIGRSDKADIQVFDIKSSREHAEITIVGNDVIVTDLGSQNGVVVNDLAVRQHKLKDGDKLIIGQTVFKFGKIKVAGPKNKKIAKTNEDEFVDDEEAPSKKKNPLVLLIVIGAAAYFFLGDKGGNSGGGMADRKRMRNKGVFKQQTIMDDFTTAVNQKKHRQDKVTNKKLQLIFQKGLREYRSANYFRAMNEFKKALIIKPDDMQANFYLRKTKDALDNTILEHRDKGTRDYNSLKYSSAIVEFCSIIRMLQNYPEDKRYVNADKKVKEIEKLMGLEKGEVKCFKK